MLVLNFSSEDGENCFGATAVTSEVDNATLLGQLVAACKQGVVLLNSPLMLQPLKVDGHVCFAQAAYVQQYLEAVRRRQAELAGQARQPGGLDDKTALPQDAKTGSEGDRRLKAEDGVAEPAAAFDSRPKTEVRRQLIMCCPVMSVPP